MFNRTGFNSTDCCIVLIAVHTWPCCPRSLTANSHRTCCATLYRNWEFWLSSRVNNIIVHVTEWILSEKSFNVFIQRWLFHRLWNIWENSCCLLLDCSISLAMGTTWQQNEVRSVTSLFPKGLSQWMGLHVWIGTDFMLDATFLFIWACLGLALGVCQIATP